MAYQPNIPAATDQLSKSQADIQGNFQAIKTLVDVNHEDFASPAAGKHKQIDFTDQSSNLPITAAATTEVLYLATEIAPFVALGQQLYLKNPAGTRIPITASSQLSNGFTYLPSGIIMLWGFKNSLPIGNTTILFSTFTNFPGFTAALNGQLSNAGNTVNNLFISALSNSGITINSSVANGAAFYTVIGF